MKYFITAFVSSFFLLLIILTLWGKVPGFYGILTLVCLFIAALVTGWLRLSDRIDALESRIKELEQSSEQDNQE